MFDRIKATLRAYRVAFDVFFSERALHEGTPSAVERGIERLSEQGHLYRSEGALWLRTTDFGDEKDRVLERSTGQPTYFAADVAYAENKLERGFDLLVIPLGSDHHGYVARLKANMAALGAGAERLEIPLLQFVHIVEGGSRASMSKRRGEFITLDDLLAQIGVDAARYFMLSRSNDSTIDLDLDLARQQSAENPVYYIQYAHARIASVRRKAGEERVARALATTGLARRAAPLRARAGQEAARLPRRGRRSRRAPRAAPHRVLRARPRPGLHRLLPRLPGRGRRARRAGGLAAAPVGRDAADDRPRPGPARGRGAGGDVTAASRV